MNQDHVNKQPSAEKYVTGDPSSFGEDPNTDDRWKEEQGKRNEIGMGEIRKDTFNHPEKTAALNEALLVKKADLATTVARMMLPKTASEQMVEDQAFNFMFLPDNALLDTHARLAADQGDEQGQAAQDQEQAKQANDQQGQGEQSQAAQEQEQAKQANDQQGQGEQQDQGQDKQATLRNAIASTVKASLARVARIKKLAEEMQTQAEQVQQAAQQMPGQQMQQQAQQLVQALQGGQDQSQVAAQAAQLAQQAAMAAAQNPQMATQAAGLAEAAGKLAEQCMALQQEATSGQQDPVMAMIQAEVQKAVTANQGMQNQATQEQQAAQQQAQQAAQKAQQAAQQMQQGQPQQQQAQQQMPVQQAQQAPVQQGVQSMDDEILNDMMGGPPPGASEMDVQLDAPAMDLADIGLGPEDEVLTQLFTANQEAQDAQAAQDQDQGQGKQAHTVRTASTRTVGTKPTAGVSRIGGAGGANAPAAGGEVNKLASLWQSAPDVRDAFGLPK
jgi:hypothetical protein